MPFARGCSPRLMHSETSHSAWLGLLRFSLHTLTPSDARGTATTAATSHHRRACGLNPQLGQTEALLLISVPHSLHLIKAMTTPENNPKHSTDATVTAPLRDHHIAEVVNRLRDVAVAWYSSDQLRERLAAVIRPLLKPAPELPPVGLLRQDIMARMSKLVPVDTTLWPRWPGTWSFAQAAIEAFEDRQAPAAAVVQPAACQGPCGKIDCAWGCMKGHAWSGSQKDSEDAGTVQPEPQRSDYAYQGLPAAGPIGHWSDGPETFVIVKAKDTQLGAQTYGPSEATHRLLAQVKAAGLEGLTPVEAVARLDAEVRKLRGQAKAPKPIEVALKFDAEKASELVEAALHDYLDTFVPPGPNLADRLRAFGQEIANNEAPAVAGDPEVAAFLAEVRAEILRARAKFPGDRVVTVALAEEFGELCKAVLDESAANVRKEAVQTATMRARLALDGDGSVGDWRAQKGLDPLVRAEAKKEAA
jgi:hypothetical protein